MVEAKHPEKAAPEIPAEGVAPETKMAFDLMAYAAAISASKVSELEDPGVAAVPSMVEETIALEKYIASDDTDRHVLDLVVQRQTELTEDLNDVLRAMGKIHEDQSVVVDVDTGRAEIETEEG